MVVALMGVEVFLELVVSRSHVFILVVFTVGAPTCTLGAGAVAVVVGFPAELLLVIMIEKLTRFD